MRRLYLARKKSLLAVTAIMLMTGLMSAFTPSSVDAQEQVTYYLPWEGGVSGTLTQEPHACDPSHCASIGLQYAYDFAAFDGKVRASAPGEVYAIHDGVPGFQSSGVGNYVVLKHADDTCTLYAHMENQSVVDLAVGSPVEQGEQLGKMGNTGFSDGAHLHTARQQCSGSEDDGQAPTMALSYAEGDVNVRNASYASQNPGSGGSSDNGTTDLFLYGPGSSADRLLVFDNNNWSFGPQPSISGTYEGYPGDFDGDGDTDVFWYGPGGASDRVSVNNGNGAFSTVVPKQINGTYDIIPGDFDGE